MSARARFEHRVVAVRRRPARVIASAVAALVVLGLVGWLLLGSSVLAVAQVEVVGVEGADRETILAAAQVPAGMPLARVDTGSIGARVGAVPFVRSAAVSRSWPSTILVSVTPREPLFAIRSDAGVGLVDDALAVYRVVEQLPSGVALVNAGTSVPDRDGLGAVLAVLQIVPPELRARITGITVTSASLVSFTVDRSTVIWGGRGQEAKKLAVLQVLLRDKPAVIDVSAPDTPVTR